MSAETRAALLRFTASLHDRTAAELRLAASAVIASESMTRLAEVMQSASDAELATHPDMAELNVRLDGFYGS